MNVFKSAATGSSKHATSFYNNKVLEEFAAKKTNRVTLRQLAVFGRNLNESKLLQSANYVRKELPVRLAHRIRDFQDLPFIVGTNPNIEYMYNLYFQAFDKFRSIPEINTLEDNKRFYYLLKDMLNAHIIVIQKLAMGVRETAHHMKHHQADRFLNEMLRSRIGRRVIAQQHMSLTDEWEGRKSHSDSQIGLVNTSTDAFASVEKCVKLASDLFRENYHIEPPDVEIEGHLETKLTYISHHLEYILYELIRNSMQYTVQFHSPNGLPIVKTLPAMAEEALLYASQKSPPPLVKKGEFPPIKVTIGHSDTEVMFRISDQGGGMEKELVDKVWSYFYMSGRSKAGLGMGLPISRAYANYWGGSIELQSMHGYGTDTYVKISTENISESISMRI